MELSKNYMPSATEEKWYRHWLGKGYFNSTPDHRPPYTVVIPPPNVTGVLHMGHTLNETVQDILVRKARMSGYNACWVPGSDHASIATEARVVNMLKEKGIDKLSLTREEFLRYAFEWKEKYGGIIYNQIERLGCSVDWNRVTFTMDDHYYKAVIKVFVDLYNKGLIYRGARMINWDPAAKTALSDEEVEHRDVQGELYYVKYMLDEGAASPAENEQSKAWLPTDDQTLENDSFALAVGSMKDDSAWLFTEPSGSVEQAQAGAAAPSQNYITIATQRPETIMGDTAICVNPGDERYAHLRGAYAFVPLINRRIPIIFDEYVDKAFGTGALKVTPAHDINDYNLGLKYNLDVIDTLNEDGTMSEAAQLYVGEDRFTARRKIVVALEENGNLLKKESNATRLGYSQRTGVVVEPRISTQWFVKMKEMAAPALLAVTSGEIKIHPGEKFLATYKYWMENVKDWCISRQLWWGQQIPAWYDGKGNMVVAETAAEARQLYTEKYPLHDAAAQLTQDEDVLDTWFSSWLWPMEVFNGISQPENNPDFAYYYPGNVLVTGQDIIFFWVARMIMAGMEFENRIPFSDVYFTGMVRDKQGRKMSKSLGNSPDLLDLIDSYGADAVRFGIMISSPAGNDLLFDDMSLEQGRNFCNKLWNALKLVTLWKERTAESPQAAQHFAAGWLEQRLRQAGREVDGLLSQFRLSEALKVIYSLVWDDFCSWYLEWIKPLQGEAMPAALCSQTIGFFTRLMQMLHPFMPFITEEIYHLLTERSDDLCIRQFPGMEPADEATLGQGQTLKDAITAIRDARNKNQLKPREPVQLHIHTAAQPLYQRIGPILSRQVNASSIQYTQEAVPGSITVVCGADTLYIQTAGPLDTAGQKESLLKEIDYLKGFINIIDKKLGNDRFVQNAKHEVVELERRKRSDAEAKIRVIEESLAGLS